MAGAANPERRPKLRIIVDKKAFDPFETGKEPPPESIRSYNVSEPTVGWRACRRRPAPGIVTSRSRAMSGGNPAMTNSAVPIAKALSVSARIGRGKPKVRPRAAAGASEASITIDFSRDIP